MKLGRKGTPKWEYDFSIGTLHWDVIIYVTIRYIYTLDWDVHGTITIYVYFKCYNFFCYNVTMNYDTFSWDGFIHNGRNWGILIDRQRIVI